MRQNKKDGEGSGFAVQNSTIFMGDDILEGLVKPFDMVSSVQSSNWCFLGEKVHSWPRNLGRSSHFWTGAVYSLISVFQQPLLFIVIFESLTFAWTALSGF